MISSFSTEVTEVIVENIQNGDHTADLIETLELSKIIEDKINQLDLREIEILVYRVSSKELKFVEVMGAILGFIIGLIQVLLVGVM